MWGCLGWLFLGFFYAMLKTFTVIIKGLWTLILWLLQTISGVPLYYCSPGYLIPAKILGTIGLLTITCAPLIRISTSDSQKRGISGLTFILMFAAGAGFLWLSRFLIRRGSI